MIDEMKTQIVEDLKKARLTGDITAKQVKGIVQGAVSKTDQRVRESAGSISDIAKEATSSVIKELEKDGKATKEYISSVFTELSILFFILKYSIFLLEK